MSRDRRFWAANARVAHEDLAGQVDVALVAPEAASVVAPVADLCREPGRARDKQLLKGEAFQVLERYEGHAFGRDPVDGYVGYVAETALGAPVEATHVVTALFAPVLSRPELKSVDVALLPLGARLRVVGAENGYVSVDGGWIAAPHIAAVPEAAPDWVAVAEAHLGAPYLWGGDTGLGLDCSGLVHRAMRAAGVRCPRDSDLLAAAFGEAGGPLRRSDLVFWKGHVGIMVDGETLLHANAHHMVVAREPLDEAVARIGAREFGAVTKYARP